MLDKFLAEADSDLAPVETSAQNVVLDPGPVPPFVPTGKQTEPVKPVTH